MHTPLNRRGARLGVLALATAAALSASEQAGAQTVMTWTGASSTNFAAVANWNISPSMAYIAQFSGTPTRYTAGLTASRSQAGLVFNTASPFTINNIAGNGVRTLSLTNGASVVVSQGHHVIDGDVVTGELGGLRLSGNTFNIASGSSLTITSRISQESAGSFVLTGGGTLVFQANNGGLSGWTFGAGQNFTVQQGVLQIDDTNGGGGSANSYVVAGSGAAIHMGSTASFNYSSGTLTIEGSGIGGGGAVRVLGGSRILGGATSSIILSDNASLGAANGATMNVRSVVSGAHTLTAAGPGTIMFTANNTYSGGTVIESGSTLQVGNAGTVGALGSGNVANGGTLRFNRSNALTVNNAVSGSGTLQQSGSSTLTLGSANTYTGTTRIDSGTLALASGGSLANSAEIRVASGATFSVNAKTTGSGTFSLGDGQSLTGSGTVSGTSGGTFQMAAGSLLSPGSSPGTLTFENVNLTLAPDSVTLIEVYGVNPGEFDVVSGSDNNTVTFGGTLQIAFAYDTLPTTGTTLDIFTHWQTYAGSFDSIVQVGEFLSPNVSFNHTTGQLNFSGDWALNVPEPSTLALLLFGLAAVLRLRRR